MNIISVGIDSSTKNLMHYCNCFHVPIIFNRDINECPLCSTLAQLEKLDTHLATVDGVLTGCINGLNNLHKG